VIRGDLSDRLIHLTRGRTVADSQVTKVIRDREAMANFSSILRGGRLVGGDGNIVGGHKCICFSEAPIASLAHMLASGPNKYAPLGVMVDKVWLFAQGGRPVIYEPLAEYNSLPESHRYRHVNYDPVNEGGDDHDVSWEREWRVRTDSLLLDPTAVTFVVPFRSMVESVKEEHAMNWRPEGYALDDVIMHVEPPQLFPYHFLVLADLGFEIEFG
jgi:hypothetical protein